MQGRNRGCSGCSDQGRRGLAFAIGQWPRRITLAGYAAHSRSESQKRSFRCGATGFMLFIQSAITVLNATLTKLVAEGKGKRDKINVSLSSCMYCSVFYSSCLGKHLGCKEQSREPTHTKPTREKNKTKKRNNCVPSFPVCFLSGHKPVQYEPCVNGN